MTLLVGTLVLSLILNLFVPINGVLWNLAISACILIGGAVMSSRVVFETPWWVKWETILTNVFIVLMGTILLCLFRLVIYFF